MKYIPVFLFLLFTKTSLAGGAAALTSPGDSFLLYIPLAFVILAWSIQKLTYF